MKKLLSLILALAMTASAAGCAAQPASGSASAPASVSAPSSAVSAPAAEKPATDPSGAEVNIPDEIGSVVVLAPSIAETLVALGCGDLIVGYDAQSVGLAGLPADVPTFDMMQPDMEQLAALKPDVLFVSNMTLYDQTNPYQQLIDLGVCVLCVPTADSIAAIQEDIAFIAAAMGKTAEGDALIVEMQAELDRIAAIGATVTEKKSVYFEIGAAPNLYSFGTGVFLNEMIELIGAENILADQQGWLAVEALAGGGGRDRGGRRPRRHPHQRELHRRACGRNSGPRRLGRHARRAGPAGVLHRQHGLFPVQPQHREGSGPDGKGRLSRPVRRGITP